MKNEGRITLYWRVVAGSVMILAGVAAGIALMVNYDTLEGVGIFGVVVLFSMLIGSNIMSGSFDFSKAEVRRAISVSIVSVFFMLLGKADRINIEENLVSLMLKNFWWIIITVVVFYFGSRTIEFLKGGR